MIQIPYFSSEEIEKIINNKEDLTNYFKENNVNEKFVIDLSKDKYSSEDEMYEGEEEYEDEMYEDEESESENDVENMSDKEKIKLAYEILSMTSYEDEFFMSILGRLRKVMRK